MSVKIECTRIDFSKAALVRVRIRPAKDNEPIRFQLYFIAGDSDYDQPDCFVCLPMLRENVITLNKALTAALEETEEPPTAA